MRKFLIPQLLLGAALPGCSSNSIVGDWKLTGVTYDGEEMELTYSYSENGYSYEAKISGELAVEDDLAAKFSISISYTYEAPGEAPESYTYRDSVKGTAEKKEAKRYIINFKGEEVDKLDCVIDSEEMTCEMGSTDDEMIFERD